MTTVKLQGGLGNQMFQYAFGRAVSERIKTKLVLDISFYDKSPNRIFELNKFNIKAEIKKYGIVNRIIEKIPIIKSKIVTEKSQIYDSEILNSPDGTIFDGYWQSEKYFKEIENEIREELTLKTDLGEPAQNWADKITSGNAVSVHIRRGDYLSEKHIKIFGLLPMDYYLTATKIIAEKSASPVFFVFSDDIAWAKENLKLPYPTKFVSIPNQKITAPEEMILMNRCKHNIIANSSFSWWSAWLNQNPNKIVIAPKNWFANKSRSSSDIMPDNWIKI